MMRQGGGTTTSREILRQGTGVKKSKPAMEKRRRARINASLAELRSLIPESVKRNSRRYSKMEKADILEMAVQYLRHLQEANKDKPQVNATSYSLGFSECTQEVSEFFRSASPFSSHLKGSLLEHLSGCAPHNPPDSPSASPRKAASSATQDDANNISRRPTNEAFTPPSIIARCLLSTTPITPSAISCSVHDRNASTPAAVSSTSDDIGCSGNQSNQNNDVCDSETASDVPRPQPVIAEGSTYAGVSRSASACRDLTSFFNDSNSVSNSVRLTDNISDSGSGNTSGSGNSEMTNNATDPIQYSSSSNNVVFTSQIFKNHNASSSTTRNNDGINDKDNVNETGHSIGHNDGNNNSIVSNSSNSTLVPVLPNAGVMNQSQDCMVPAENLTSKASVAVSSEYLNSQLQNTFLSMDSGLCDQNILTVGGGCNSNSVDSSKENCQSGLSLPDRDSTGVPTYEDSSKCLGATSQKSSLSQIHLGGPRNPNSDDHQVLPASDVAVSSSPNLASYLIPIYVQTSFGDGEIPSFQQAFIIKDNPQGAIVSGTPVSLTPKTLTPKPLTPVAASADASAKVDNLSSDSRVPSSDLNTENVTSLALPQQSRPSFHQGFILPAALTRASTKISNNGEYSQITDVNTNREEQQYAAKVQSENKASRDPTMCIKSSEIEPMARNTVEDNVIPNRTCFVFNTSQKTEQNLNQVVSPSDTKFKGDLGQENKSLLKSNSPPQSSASLENSLVNDFFGVNDAIKQGKLENHPSTAAVLPYFVTRHQSVPKFRPIAPKSNTSNIMLESTSKQETILGRNPTGDRNHSSHDTVLGKRNFTCADNDVSQKEATTCKSIKVNPPDRTTLSENAQDILSNALKGFGPLALEYLITRSQSGNFSGLKTQEVKHFLQPLSTHQMPFSRHQSCADTDFSRVHENANMIPEEGCEKNSHFQTAASRSPHQASCNFHRLTDRECNTHLAEGDVEQGYSGNRKNIQLELPELDYDDSEISVVCERPLQTMSKIQDMSPKYGTGNVDSESKTKPFLQESVFTNNKRWVSSTMPNIPSNIMYQEPSPDVLAPSTLWPTKTVDSTVDHNLFGHHLTHVDKPVLCTLHNSPTPQPLNLSKTGDTFQAYKKSLTGTSKEDFYKSETNFNNSQGDNLSPDSRISDKPCSAFHRHEFQCCSKDKGPPSSRHQYLKPLYISTNQSFDDGSSHKEQSCQCPSKQVPTAQAAHPKPSCSCEHKRVCSCFENPHSTSIFSSPIEFKNLSGQYFGNVAPKVPRPAHNSSNIDLTIPADAHASPRPINSLPVVSFSQSHSSRRQIYDRDDNGNKPGNHPVHGMTSFAFSGHPLKSAMELEDDVWRPW